MQVAKQTHGKMVEVAGRGLKRKLTPRSSPWPGRGV